MIILTHLPSQVINGSLYRRFPRLKQSTRAWPNRLKIWMKRWAWNVFYRVKDWAMHSFKLQRLAITRGPSTTFPPFFGGRQSNVSMAIVVFIFLSVSLRCSIVVRSGIIAQLLRKRKPGLSLNHIAETFFANETFVKAALRMYKKQN